jgi:hypothetical protein
MNTNSLLPFVLAISSCGFSGAAQNADASGGQFGDARATRDDADPGVPVTAFDVAHLGSVEFAALTSSTTIDRDTLIDTSTTAGPLGLQFEEQLVGGRVAVAYFDQLTINARVRITGANPLVIVAKNITIESGGELFAGADLNTAGAGGGGNGGGPGAGGQGKISPTSTLDDSGGGGAGYGTVGQPGGTARTDAAAGSAGAAYGGVGRLEGGSVGGAAVTCVATSRGGAGGGAVQLSAAHQLSIGGLIDAGGGGGTGGAICDNGQTYAAGSGGGAGGMIFLQGEAITVSGAITANGGAGGSGAVYENNLARAGVAGQNGMSALRPANGGPAVTGYDNSGGNGGYGNTAPTAGGNYRNGGGGGGAVGRIVVQGAQQSLSIGTFSPTL